MPDVLGVALQGSIGRLDRWTGRIVTSARAATRGALLVVVAGTGSAATGHPASAEALLPAVEAAVPGETAVVAADAPGGLFLDQAALTELGITGQAAVDALLALRAPGDGRMFADAFQGFAVTFARYC
ncbi:MAG: hypothetical protein KatS3mg014_1007 [Actinomycetota bacterium]|nr:MAG: hypothetical protein KatS3mg014_1007 [Actinomycetota bacterium]